MRTERSKRHEKAESTGDKTPAVASKGGSQLFAKVTVQRVDGTIQHSTRQEADPSEGGTEMKDTYAKVFEEIVKAFEKHTKIINELAKTCLTIKQYEEFVKMVNELEKPTIEED